MKAPPSLKPVRLNWCVDCHYADRHNRDEQNRPYCTLDEGHTHTPEQLKCFCPIDQKYDRPRCTWCGKRIPVGSNPYLLIDRTSEYLFCDLLCLAPWAAGVEGEEK